MQRLSTIARSQLRQLTRVWPALTMHLAMAVLFVCVAALFAALTGFVGGLTWILVWPTFSLVIVAYGYVVVGPAVLGKQADGTLYWPHALLLMPYFSAAECAWYLVRVLGREEPWHEVSRGLYLGRRAQHWELPARVGLVLDMTAEFVEPVEVRSAGSTSACPRSTLLYPVLRHWFRRSSAWRASRAISMSTALPVMDVQPWRWAC